MLKEILTITSTIANWDAVCFWRHRTLLVCEHLNRCTRYCKTKNHWQTWFLRWLRRQQKTFWAHSTPDHSARATWTRCDHSSTSCLPWRTWDTIRYLPGIFNYVTATTLIKLFSVGCALYLRNVCLGSAANGQHGLRRELTQSSSSYGWRVGESAFALARRVRLPSISWTGKIIIFATLPYVIHHFG